MKRKDDKPEPRPQDRRKAKEEAGRSGGGPMLNQTGLARNPVSNETARTGNQSDYEPGQPMRESNRPGNRGNTGSPGRG